jgi:hypothetical protein
MLILIERPTKNMNVILNLWVSLHCPFFVNNTAASNDKYTTTNINPIFSRAGKLSKELLAASLEYGDHHSTHLAQ